jgi:hypothetical protein
MQSGLIRIFVREVVGLQTRPHKPTVEVTLITVTCDGWKQRVTKGGKKALREFCKFHYLLNISNIPATVLYSALGLNINITRSLSRKYLRP